MGLFFFFFQIVPLKALKLEYKSFEAKRNLANMYDLFLADARIIRLLPPYLGKAFYGRKRYITVECCAPLSFKRLLKIFLK